MKKTKNAKKEKRRNKRLLLIKTCFLLFIGVDNTPINITWRSKHNFFQLPRFNHHLKQITRYMHKFFCNSFLFPDFKMGLLADSPITHTVPVLLEGIDNEDNHTHNGLTQAFNNLELWLVEESDDDEESFDVDNELTLLERLEVLQTLHRILNLITHTVPETLEESDEEDNLSPPLH